MTRRFKLFWQWLRFGRITEKVMAIDGGVDSEVAYFDRFGICVGYWAYGYWNPNMPYRGGK